MSSILDRAGELFGKASDWLVARCARLPRHTLAWSSIGLALILLLSVNLFASSALRNAKADLTQQRLFTISNGTRGILQAIDEPVSVRLYFSKKLAEAAPVYGRYFDRVRAHYVKFLTRAQSKEVNEFHRQRRWAEHRNEAWKALKEQDISAARKHAKKALPQNYFSVEAWKLVYCAMRGH